MKMSQRITAGEIELAKVNDTIEELKNRWIDALVTEQYSVGEQIALLRQKEQKPEEFARFDRHAEMCKEMVKRYIENPSLLKED